LNSCFENVGNIAQQNIYCKPFAPDCQIVYQLYRFLSITEPEIELKIAENGSLCAYLREKTLFSGLLTLTN
jgi:hypothetical protein